MSDDATLKLSDAEEASIAEAVSDKVRVAEQAAAEAQAKAALLRKIDTMKPSLHDAVKRLTEALALVYAAAHESEGTMLTGMGLGFLHNDLVQRRMVLLGALGNLGLVEAQLGRGLEHLPSSPASAP